LGVLLDMELQRQYFAVIVAERLMRRDRGFGEPSGATRQVEGIAVPMEHPELVLGERGERRFAPIGGEAEQAPTDLLLAIRIDTGAEYRGERLPAEANADDWLAAGNRLLDNGELLLEERIAVDLIDADRRAEHDEDVGVLGRREIIDAGLQIAKLDAAAGNCVFQRAGILEGNVTD